MGIIKRIFISFVFVIVFSGGLFSENFTGKCVGVLDGDSILVLQDGKVVIIRLDGVDCPEKYQDFGTRARKFTVSMIFRKYVKVYVKAIDSYGRIVGRVYVEELDLSLELLKNGLAWHNKKYNLEKLLAEAEQEARDKKIGLWSMANPIPPWVFRRKIN